MKFGLLITAGGAIVKAVIRFNWGSWVTAGVAEAMAKEITRMVITERREAL